jgi:hypothetical protein
MTKITIPLKYHSDSCACERCLSADARLTFLTTNNFQAEVIFDDTSLIPGNG